ncbi:uncharacterized protein LOC128809965 [Vidua macroura]|uniref:uncharacterized protein LOC128809965 n=1 Tax=Vidua macroura TaxID=187451 RepID=UPI0023A81C8D|nr:uncharacterized protein LOC128809965 [Vidua macroura]
MEKRPPRVPKLAWVEEEEEGPGAAPAQETEKVVPFHPPQEGAALDCTQEQESTRGRFRRAAQLVCKFIKSIRQEETISRGTGLRDYSEVLKHETSAALLDLLVERGVFRPEQVPAMVRYIHQWLTANDSAEHRLDNTLLHLTKVQPNDAVMTLLRVAPSCDRYGAHLPRGLRAPPSPSPCTACPRCLTNREFQGPLAAPFPSPGMSAPQACCHAPSLPLRGHAQARVLCLRPPETEL